MIKKSAKIILNTVAIGSILSMLTIIACFIWVTVAPRSLNFIKPYIEKQISEINPEYSAKIENSFIEWDRKQYAISIHASDVDIINESGEIIVNLPEISLGFSAMRLFKGKLLSSDLTIMRPSIHVNTAQKMLYVSEENGASLKEIALSTIYSTLNSRRIFNLNSIRVQDINIFLNNGVSDMMWKIDEGYAKLETEKKNRRIKSEFKINFGKDSSYFALNITDAGENMIETEITFKDLPSYTFAEIFPGHGIEQKVDMVFSGKTNLLVSDDGTISQAMLNLENTSGKLDLPELFKDTINIKNLKLNANLYNGLSDIAINNLNIDLFGPIFQASGNLHNTKTWPEFIPTLDMTATVDNMEVDDVSTYWSYRLGNMAWEWVTKNITEGVVTHAEGRFKFEGKDIENIIAMSKSGAVYDTALIPDDAIDATVELEKAKINYMDNYPIAETTKSTVKFTGHTMKATVEGGKILSTTAKNVHVAFDNLWAHHLTIKIDGDFTGPAQDAIVFLKKSYKEKPDGPQLAAIYNMTGDNNSHVSVVIPFKHDLKYDDIDLKISANVKNALIPGLVNGKNITSQNLDFTLDKYDITANGDVVLNNNLPSKIELKKNLAPNTPESDIELKFKGALSPQEIKELAAVDIPFVTGKIGLDVKIQVKNAESNVVGNADIAQSEVIMPNFGFKKDKGKSGNISFDITKNSKSDIILKEFKARGDGFDINGSGKIDGASQSFSQLILTSAKFTNNDIVANYKSSSAGDILEITGKNLDLSNAKFSEWFRKNPTKKPVPLSVNAKVGTVYMKNGEVLNDVSATLNCTEKRCLSGSLYGKLKSGYLIVNLKDIGDRSSLLVESDNAGAIINALNISQNITRGHLNIDATIGKQNNNSVALGVVKISNFTATKTPLLGKILTLASFRGFEDLLNNQGISFKRFEAPFVMANNIITIKDAKSSGASIGLTTAGTINTQEDVVDLKGVIVPAYAVNNIIGKIPFVGKIIIGNDGEGVLATKYSITGPYDDVKISVNPLSILTPGFLRNLFDIFD